MDFILRSDALPLGAVRSIVTHARSVSERDDDSVAGPPDIADGAVLDKTKLISAGTDDDRFVTTFKVSFFAAQVFRGPF
jgi:hypothetical protein